MAKYQVMVQDAWPFLKPQLIRSVASALLLVIAGTLVFMIGRGAAGLTAFGIGIGLAIGFILDAYLQYKRTRQLYGAHTDIELSVGPDEIIFASDVRHTTIHRSPKVKVVESHGAFVITIGDGTSPVLVPIRCLTPAEADIMRQWMTM